MSEERVYRLMPYGIPSKVNGKQNPEYHRLYYREKREKIRARQREYFSGNTGVSRSPQWIRRYTMNYRDIAVTLLLQRDGDNCGVCGKPMTAADLSIDHIQPRSTGGDDVAENLRLAHRLCNASRPRPRYAEVLNLNGTRNG